MSTNHYRGVQAVVEHRGNKLVITIQAVSGSPEEGITGKLMNAIDIAYIENGKTYAREISELWAKGYTMKCEDCNKTHRLSLEVLNAFIMIGEGMVKAQLALLSSTLDDVHLN